MNEDENKSKVVFVDLEEYKQMGKVRKDPDPVPQKAQKTAPVSEEKKGPSAAEKTPEKKSTAEKKSRQKHRKPNQHLRMKKRPVHIRRRVGKRIRRGNIIICWAPLLYLV